MQFSEAEIFERAPNMALRLSMEPFLYFSQLMLSLPQIRLIGLLEHEASVGIDAKLVDVARAGVVNT